MSSVIKGRGFTPIKHGSRNRSSRTAAAAWPSEGAAAWPSGAAAAAPVSPMVSPVAPSSPVADVVPNYDFPVVYYLITHADIQLSPMLNAYINMQTNACNQHSTPAGFVNPPNEADSRHLFLSSDHEICVLFMYWDAAHHASLYHSVFNDLGFLNEHVLGHAKIKHHPPNLAIYNFCKHTIIPSAEGSSRLRTRDEDFGSVGTAMFNALLTATSFLPPGFNQNVTTLWLGIDVANAQFSKVAKIYTVEGFSNPIITNRDVDGTETPIAFLQLTRPMHNYVDNQITSMNNFNEVMNLMHQWDEGGKTSMLYYRFSFDRSCILSLHLFPFIVFNASNVPIGLGRHEGQRETSGTFVVINSVYDAQTKEGHDVMSLKTVENSPGVRRIAFNVGQHGSVTAAVDEATFHTHPFVMYKRTSTMIGPPSSPDLLSFIHTFLILHLSGNNTSFKFSLVSTMEGVHIVSFKPNGIRVIMDHLDDAQTIGLLGVEAAIEYVLQQMRAMILTYEYPEADRRYNWDRQYSISKPKNDEALMDPIDAYDAFFTEIDNANGGLFQWQWVDWENLTTDYEMQVYYLDNRIKIF